MFDNLSEKLQEIIKKASGNASLTEENMADALREVRRALLEADVSLKVVKIFMSNLKEKALGEDVLKGVNPSQQLIKIVHDELVNILGNENKPLILDGHPSLIMMLGLQGSGKTTSAAKLAIKLKKEGKNPLLVAADVYRPAAITQLKTLGEQTQTQVFTIDESKDVQKIVTEAIEYAKANGFNVVIIDTAGRLQIDNEMMAELMLIDKKNELSIFNELPHLIDNSLNNDDDIISALRNLEGELRERNNKITNKGARNIQEYNKRARNKLPYIVLIIDELQDLLSRDIKKEAERIINTIASLGRSAGIHIIAATQRPSAKVITGELKANLPTKIALSVANNTDSRVILDHKGAEDLIGNGDALLKRKESVKLEHIQVPYVTTEEIERIIDYINSGR